ncbi:neuronal acetylcholine receptor subunit beta-3-like [Ptychodera flava]|uniref:neuronal acetylcholine receptor subunit beta-3-like n=1 Tax=Ptychodera flava TaxID=63121 RepID=UPI00396A3D2E
MKTRLLCDTVAFLLFAVSHVIATQMVQQLQSHIFNDSYNKHIRPARDQNDSVTMNFGLSVTQLLDIDEKNQVITVGVWLDQYWNDYRLKWNASDFGGIESVIVPFQWLWYPDLVLDNSADGEYLLPLWKYVTVYNDGEVWVTPPGKLSSPCDIDVRYFPFDEQFCVMSFGPWEFTAFEVLMNPINDYVPRENYVENVEWEFFNSTVELELDLDECCPDEAYSTIIYTLILRRRPLYYILNILIPCVAMSLLTLGVFYLPPDSGEKMTLSISVLIALSVFSLLVAEIMPPTSNSSPLIGTFLLFNMAVNALSIIMSVVVLHFHHRSVRIYRMPPWVRRVFLQKLPTYIGLGRHYVCAKRNVTNTVEPVDNETVDVVSLDNHKAHENHNYECETASQTPRTERRANGVVALQKSLMDSALFRFGQEEKNPEETMTSFEKKVSTFLDYSTRRMQWKETEEEAMEEWKLLAAVVDRICLVCFFFVLSVGSLSILLTAPRL